MPKPLPRQMLIAGLRATVDRAIDQGDQRWGRALATTLEKQLVRLRITFGHGRGEPIMVPTGTAAPAMIRALRAAGRDPGLDAQTLANRFPDVDARWAWESVNAVRAKGRTSMNAFLNDIPYHVEIKQPPEEDWSE